MKRFTLYKKPFSLLFILCTACTNNSELLQSNEYPLQIASATVSSSETASRVAENADGTSSQWTDGDRISVRIGDDGKTGTYTLNADGSVKTADNPVYWQSRAAQTVTAWYPASDGTIDLSDQTAGLKYVLKATAENMTFSDAVNLDFRHQLAKVRVKLSGDAVSDVTAVAVKGMTSFSVKQGAVGEATNEGYIKMMKATYSDGDYYEANLTPQIINADDFMQITTDGKTFICKMECDITTIESGNAYIFTVTVISDDKAYVNLEKHIVYTFEEGQITETPDIITSAISNDGYLKIVGPINQNDFETVIEKCKDKITVLDMSEAYGTELKISDEAFVKNTSLTSISFPQGLIRIGESAFRGCTNLFGTLVIPEGVTEVGEKAFGECKNISTVKFPSTMTTIKNGTFAYCDGLTEIDIPANITTIEGYRMHYAVTYQGAFKLCKNLKTLTLHPGLTRIGDNAFADCVSLKEVSIPESVNSIGVFAFYNCSGLTKVNLPQTLEDIDDYAFSECVGLEEPLYNESVFVYYHSDSNVSYSIPYGIKRICGGAFYKFSGLQSIDIPTTVEYIGNSAFAYCTSLKSLYVPQFVTTIETGAFEYCSNLTTVTLPQNMPSLEFTFEGCTNLQTVEFLPETSYLKERLTTLYYTFKDCTSLTSFTIPESVTSIGEFTFNGCSNLTSITIPDGVTTIGNQAFYGCNNLTAVTCKTTTPPLAGSETFTQATKNGSLKVPIGSIDTYKRTSPWSEFSNISAMEE